MNWFLFIMCEWNGYWTKLTASAEKTSIVKEAINTEAHSNSGA